MPIIINSEDTKRQFAAQSMEWLESIPDERHDWCDALVAGAIDECNGDLLKALELAKSTYIANPEPPNESEIGADTPTILYHPESQLEEGVAGYSSMPDVPTPMPDPPTKVVKVTNVMRDSEGRIIGTTVEDKVVPLDE